MSAPDPQILLHLASARAALDSAIALLAGPQVVLPAGVRVPAGDCAHPAKDRLQAMGGYWSCGLCGYQGKD